MAGANGERWWTTVEGKDLFAQRVGKGRRGPESELVWQKLGTSRPRLSLGGGPGHRERSAEQEQTETGMGLPEQLELQQQQEASEMEIVNKVRDLSRRRIVGSGRRLDEA